MNNLIMPKIDRKLIARKMDIVNDLKKIIKSENILYHEDETRPFETDALTAYKIQKKLVSYLHIVISIELKSCREVLELVCPEALYQWQTVYFCA